MCITGRVVQYFNIIGILEFMPPAPTDIRVTDVKQNFTQMKISWNISEELLYPFTGNTIFYNDMPVFSTKFLCSGFLCIRILFTKTLCLDR